MIVTIKNNIVHYYLKIVRSIGFYPFLITVGFLLLSYFSLLFDFSEMGLNIKKSSFWISLKDAETTRTIISTITSGVISLTVFSFSMVMIVLNQTASQMSNRILDKLIGSRFQQFVLGLYLGTIVYALFLLSSIRDLDSGIQIPAISTYFLIFLTIVDLFIFIYFLHFITQSVKYETIIKRIYIETLASLEKFVFNNKEENLTNIPNQEDFAIKTIIKAPKSGVYLGFSLDDLIVFCDKNDCFLKINIRIGDYVLKDFPLIESSIELDQVQIKKVLSLIQITTSETIEENFLYGFRQIKEVGVKALSPGINDPGTAVESIRALFQLCLVLATIPFNNTVLGKNKIPRITTKLLSFEIIFERNILPIWDYGKNDRHIQNELMHVLENFEKLYPKEIVFKLKETIQLHCANR
jgi:uncharacterized membrane protein